MKILETIKEAFNPNPDPVENKTPDVAPKAWIPLKGREWHPLQSYPRNNKCFCQSGKKFKQCCLKRVPRTCTIEEGKKFKALMKAMGL
jgi:hypothetical protein